MRTTITPGTADVRIAGAYEIRDTLSALGARWWADSKEWLLTEEQYEQLWVMVQESDKRSNKRDRHLADVYFGDRLTVAHRTTEAEAVRS